MKIFKRVLIILGIIGLILLMTFKGNFLSKYLAARGLDEYVDENYRELDLERKALFYDYKRGSRYVGQYKSSKSQDTFFSIDTDMLGRIKYDSYEDTVVNNWNTIMRLDKEFNEDIKRIVEENFPYKIDMMAGRLILDGYDDLKDIEGIELDMDYDLDNLPLDKDVYVNLLDDDFTWDNVARKTLELDRIMKNKKIDVKTYSLILTKMEDGEKVDSFGIYDFPRERLDSKDLPADMEEFFEDWNK